MKIFIVGSDKIYAIENYYVKYLMQSGCDVYHFTAQSIFYDYYQNGIVNKLLFKIGLSNILNKINLQFKLNVQRFNPDVIFVFKGMEIFPESLQWAKSKNIKLVNYNPDNPFIFSGKGSGNNNVKNAIKLYDLHLTYNSQVKMDMEAIYKIHTEILPFGFDVTDGLFNECIKQKEIVKACFLGNPDKHRGDFLKQLAVNGIELDVYGNNWDKFVEHPNIKILGPVLGDNFWYTLHKYRLQINLSRPHTFETHNMRSFEVPGIGGIQLAPKTKDHENYFEPDKQIFLFTDVYDCAFKINAILSMPGDEAVKIRNQARQHSLDSGYTYKDRANEALGFINTLFNE